MALNNRGKANLQGRRMVNETVYKVTPGIQLSTYYGLGVLYNLLYLQDTKIEKSFP